MTRIQLTDTLPDIVLKMSDGNPGAINVMMACVTEHEKIDPDSALKGYSTLLSMDTEGMYGSDIWVHYKDICGQDITTFIATFRAKQLGLRGSLTERVDEVVADVQKRLPRFAKDLTQSQADV